jgi:hypothetical protein
MNDPDVVVGDAFLMRVRPDAALTPNGIGESATWSVASRLVAYVTEVEEDLVAVTCSDPSYHDAGSNVRVLHRQILQTGDGFLVEPPLPQASVGCVLLTAPLHPNRK